MRNDQSPVHELRECWMPAPSRGLAFLLAMLGVSLMGLGVWAIWHIPFFSAPFAKYTAAGAILAVGTLRTFHVMQSQALLRLKNSVVQIEWLVKEGTPCWRVSTRGNSLYEFANWDRDSRVTYWGLCLTYSDASKRNRFLEWFFPRSVLLLPSQLGRTAYRQLCRRLLEDGEETETKPSDE